ncbi:hypothetical protein ZOSMA_89G00760 [Zostera marina]|uniref:Uncharacterized protein n=1 Tax=Zostera marina TaxID=29655 RepID=A0A0K9NKJ6_ZOSMR|nr:hypothetical protein ZOSMA_89G00760 [Zostera marina]
MRASLERETMGTTSIRYDQEYMEKRQVFLRSYQFSRKKTVSERIHLSIARLRRIVMRRFRVFRKARRVVWSGLRKHVVCCGQSGFRRHIPSSFLLRGGRSLEFGSPPCHWAWTAATSTVY